MIKKFESFVNEDYERKNNHLTKEQQNFRKMEEENKYNLVRILTSFCDVDEHTVNILLDRVDNSILYYTFGDVLDIFSRLDLINMPNSCQREFIKTFFDINSMKRNDGIKLEEMLKTLSKKCNDGKEYPIVIDVNGKLLTGKVWYCDDWGEYFESEDDIINRVWNDDELGNCNGIESAECFVDKELEDLNYEEIDLDKEYGYKGDSSIKETINYDQLNESFTNQELKDAIKAHGGLIVNKCTNHDARTSIVDFDLKNAKFVGYLKPETVDDIYINNCFILLYKSRDIILRTNDGGIIVVEKDDFDKNYYAWLRKVKTRNNNWIEDIVRKYPEKEYWNTSKRDIEYDSIEPDKDATYMRRSKHINRK